MSATKIVAIALIVAGALGLAYGGLTYTKNRQDIHVGSMSMTVSEHRTLPIPLWAGIAAVLVGAGLLVVPSLKS